MKSKFYDNFIYDVMMNSYTVHIKLNKIIEFDYVLRNVMIASNMAL